jgi:hypothetical protein
MLPAAPPDASQGPTTPVESRVSAPLDDVLAILEQQLLTVDGDTVHDLLLEDHAHAALERHGESALRRAALTVLQGAVGLLSDQQRGAATVLARQQAAAAADMGPDVLEQAQAVVQALEGDVVVGDAWNLLMATAHLANIHSVMEDPQADDLDRGWAEAYIPRLRAHLDPTTATVTVRGTGPGPQRHGAGPPTLTLGDLRRATANLPDSTELALAYRDDSFGPLQAFTLDRYATRDPEFPGAEHLVMFHDFDPDQDDDR